MSSEDNSFTEFLDDYFAESEAHLISVRHCLQVMEGFVDRGQIDPDVVDQLLRALHSLKGLSAMVGISDAEQIAHAMEGVLRDLKLTGAGPPESVMEALASGAKAIDEVIAAQRKQKTAPDTVAVLSRLRTVVSTPSRVWRFQFTPSSELSVRGVNVNSIRSRLQEVGRIISVTPTVVDSGQLIFDFIVASGLEERQFPDWHLDGLVMAAHDDATQAAAEVHETAAPSPPANVVRVDMKRLDDLMMIVGDLLISRTQAEESLHRLKAILPLSARRELEDANHRFRRQLRALKKTVMRMRMVPIGQIFERMHFVLRGLERESGKDVRLTLTGQDTEIDKFLVERMLDPLLHMVRNAVSHGLEPSDERIAAGKTPESHLSLRASTEAETLIIEMEDDGRGVDAERVASRARTLGLMDPGETLDTAPDNARVLQLLCTPGFSIRTKADLGAGRGVGMTIVKTTIGGLGGLLSWTLVAGSAHGSQFACR